MFDWKLTSSGLFLVNFDDVVLLHLEGLGRFVVVDPPSIEEKPERRDRDSDPLGVALLQLAHLGAHLDPEVDLVRVLAHHLELDVLGLVLVLARHFGVRGEGVRICEKAGRKISALSFLSFERRMLERKAETNATIEQAGLCFGGCARFALGQQQKRAESAGGCVVFRRSGSV